MIETRVRSRKGVAVMIFPPWAPGPGPPPGVVQVVATAAAISYASVYLSPPSCNASRASPRCDCAPARRIIGTKPPFRRFFRTASFPRVLLSDGLVVFLVVLGSPRRVLTRFLVVLLLIVRSSTGLPSGSCNSSRGGTSKKKTRASNNNNM